MKFVVESHKGLLVHGYDSGYINLSIPGHIQTRLPYDSETGLYQARQSLIISAHALISDWGPSQIDDICADHVEAISRLDPELVLLGSGCKICFPRAELTAPLQEAGIGVEVMDTAAACRTFNILASEGRHVVAALMMI
ncbi:MAG: Mth938-like domain-containing protein [Gammaproteobacteria bacterium]|nr:Mth938-like domain-containing protein [Gammaproteobacteria bacterium]